MTTNSDWGDERPIGVLDSGIGGLTVLKPLLETFPNEDFIYLGDTARIPYGTKSSKTITNYLIQCVRKLEAENVKAIVVACNSASTVVNQVSSTTPLYNVITPTARAAVNWTEQKRIGVIATRATIQKNSYVTEIAHFNPSIKVYQQSCPLFVPLVEEGWVDDPVTNLIVFRYLSPLQAAQIDTLILGCTHYPLLRNAIKKVMGSSVELIESGDALCSLLKSDMENSQVLRNFKNENQRSLRILLTDRSDFNSHLVSKILERDETVEVEQVDL